MTIENWIAMAFGALGLAGGVLMWIASIATTRALLLAHISDCTRYREQQQRANEIGERQQLEIITQLNRLIGRIDADSRK